MAVHADGLGYRTSDGIYYVEVEDLGPDDQDERGTVAIGTDLHDRMEY